MLQKLKFYDYTLIITPILLASFGLVMVYSASMVFAVVQGHAANHYLTQQSIRFGMGLIGFILCSAFPYRYYQKLIKPIILGVILLLIGVLLFGSEVNNAQSWILGIQPAEFAKLAIVMYLASVYSKKQEYIREFSKAVLPPLIITGIILALIVLQPDIGTASIVFLIACSVIFSSGIRFKHLSLLLFIGLMFLLMTLPYMATDERLTRFTGAYQPFETPASHGYQLIQSYVAIGNGGLAGEGLGQSVQKLGYLTEAHTDFIMAVVAEELGFIGVVIVIGMLSIIVLRGLFISRKVKDSFGSLLAIGISSMVGIQAFINLGAISGLLPITGVPLPFVSYGGSSLLVLLISMGILNNIAMHIKKRELEPAGENQNTRNISQAYRGGRTWHNLNKSTKY